MSCIRYQYSTLSINSTFTLDVILTFGTYNICRHISIVQTYESPFSLKLTFRKIRGSKATREH